MHQSFHPARRAVAAAVASLALAAGGLVGCTPDSAAPPSATDSPTAASPDATKNAALSALKIPGDSMGNPGKVVFDQQIQGPTTVSITPPQGHALEVYLACAQKLDSVDLSVGDVETPEDQTQKSSGPCEPALQRQLTATRRTSGQAMNVRVDVPKEVSFRVVIRLSADAIDVSKPNETQTIVNRLVRGPSTFRLKTDPSKYLNVKVTALMKNSRFKIDILDAKEKGRPVTGLAGQGDGPDASATSGSSAPTLTSEVIVRVTGDPVRLVIKESSQPPEE
ncbi:hypothetical protein [Galactobacter caseinivorans]|nr:hypothetical protein [Galactobacter caseinivorans]